MLWDCDFLLGEPTVDQPERLVLCEINVSSVSPFPPSSIEPLVAAVKARIMLRRAEPVAPSHPRLGPQCRISTNNRDQ
jgi:hypothetical protein